MPREDRAVRWSKLPAMREELHDCDFLLYLDADAFFDSHERRIEEELLPLLEDKQIMMSAGQTADSRRQTAAEVVPTPDTGVVLVRNSTRAAEMLRVWDETSDHPDLRWFCFHPPYEQGLCFQVMRQEYPDEVKLLTESHGMNGVNGMFIRHLRDMDEDERYRRQTDFLDSRWERMEECRAA